MKSSGVVSPMMQSRLKKRLITASLSAAFAFNSSVAKAQEINCDSLKASFEEKKYQQILDFERNTPPNFDQGSRLCLKNLAGLSQIKTTDTSNEKNLGYALQLFGLSAKDGYLPSAYNLLKYEFLLTNASLDPILSGLSALVEAGALDANRNVSILSYELGNRIIDSCYEQSESICKGRKVSTSAKNNFTMNTGKALEQIRAETNARTADERATKAKITMALSVLIIAAGAALAASGNLNLSPQRTYYNQQAPNPGTHPWLFQQQPAQGWHGCYGDYCW